CPGRALPPRFSPARRAQTRQVHGACRARARRAETDGQSSADAGAAAARTAARGAVRSTGTRRTRAERRNDKGGTAMTTSWRVTRLVLLLATLAPAATWATPGAFQIVSPVKDPSMPYAYVHTTQNVVTWSTSAGADHYRVQVSYGVNCQNAFWT